MARLAVGAGVVRATANGISIPVVHLGDYAALVREVGVDETDRLLRTLAPEGWAVWDEQEGGEWWVHLPVVGECESRNGGVGS